MDFLRVGSWGEGTASKHQSWWKRISGDLSDFSTHIQDNISPAGLILPCHCYQLLHFHLVPLPSNHYTTLLFKKKKKKKKRNHKTHSFDPVFSFLLILIDSLHFYVFPLCHLLNLWQLISLSHSKSPAPLKLVRCPI